MCATTATVHQTVFHAMRFRSRFLTTYPKNWENDARAIVSVINSFSSIKDLYERVNAAIAWHEARYRLKHN